MLKSGVLAALWAAGGTQQSPVPTLGKTQHLSVYKYLKNKQHGAQQAGEKHLWTHDARGGGSYLSLALLCLTSL